MNTDITTSAKSEYPVIDWNPPFTKVCGNFNTLDYLHFVTIIGVSVIVDYLFDKSNTFIPFTSFICNLGDQVHVLACLSACNQKTKIITPFKVAVVMSKNGKRKGVQKLNGNTEGETNPIPKEGNVSFKPRLLLAYLLSYDGGDGSANISPNF
ncbi:hypothetical protein V6N11_009118 [Hibiscus sabdariffa]|uniref:NADH-ubiquinone oxidoreductase 21kDa subunit N-terminal domain-containing protein n=1 Tax=Hibiscus sabdariffa TaxID=183260 RepID=A0ABR2PPP6_9ROSI